MRYTGKAMIRSFRDRDAERLFSGRTVPAFQGFARQSLRRLNNLHQASSLRDLSDRPGNRLETLSGDRQGQHSIRINRQWRVCFRWQDGNAYDVEIVDYH